MLGGSAQGDFDVGLVREDEVDARREAFQRSGHVYYFCQLRSSAHLIAFEQPLVQDSWTRRREHLSRRALSSCRSVISMSRTVLSVLGAVLLLLLAWTTVRRRKPHGLNSGIEDRPDLAYVGRRGHYYADAERHMKKQWKQIIWPRLQSADLGSVVEIAAGWGRNTEKLLKHAKKLVATDINARSIEHVRTRFARHTAVAEVGARIFM